MSRKSAFFAMSAAAAMQTVGPASAQDSLSTATFGGPAKWRAKPTGEQMVKAAPEVMNRGINGRATISCRIKPDGHVENCIIKEEIPAGAGFGAAALSLSRFFEMVPGAVDSSGRVDIPIIWKMDQSKPVPGAEADAQKRLARLKLAFDPEATPPLIEPVYSAADNHFAADHRFPQLAPIGGYYPDRAQRLGAAGAAVIACSVQADYRLAPCQRIADVPSGFFFDDAALRMAKDGYLRAPATTAVGGTVRVLVRFPNPPGQH